MTKQKKDAERRQYIRLDSVFPVDFRLTAQDGKTFLSDWIQGFTNNISRGGICLSVNNLKSEFVALIKKGEVKLLLNIQVPLASRSTPARSKPVWIEPVLNQPGQYIIGLSYQEISASANKRIVGYAWSKYLIPRISAGLLIILTLSISVSGYFNWRLRQENRKLVNQMVSVLEEVKIASQNVEKINREKEELNSRLGQVGDKIKTAEQDKEKLAEELLRIKFQAQAQDSDEAVAGEDTQRLTLLIERLKKEKSMLEQELYSLGRKENMAAESLMILDRKKASVQQATFDNMYQWLLRHQNPRTGLILSFEGDNDIAKWGFTYDQALV
ncbi:MAG: PilZ domain-containing protein, partial [Candidatus Omnitrophica bacterium]|nr:PilZ domain-containing protein [Candidatus Omnitrophota bacterium]